MGTVVDADFSDPGGARLGYQVHVPRGYAGQALPLLIVLHGCSQDGAEIAARTRFNAWSDQLSCFVAYPSQTQSANALRCWNWFRADDQRRERGEPALIAGITRAVVRQYGIEASRVFVAGLSSGAAMAVIVAAVYPELFAAVGSHSGLAYRAARTTLGAWTAMREAAGANRPLRGPVVPLIVFHGADDRTVHPANSAKLVAQWLLSVPERRRPGPPEEQTGEAQGRSFRRTLYRDARGAAFIEHWQIDRLEHAWSGGSAGRFSDPAGPDASGEMLRFFLSERGLSERGRPEADGAGGWIGSIKRRLFRH